MDAKVSLNILLSIVQHISKESPTPQPIHCYGLGAPSAESVEFISDICTPFVDAAFTGGSRSNRKPRGRRADNPGSNYRRRNRSINTNRIKPVHQFIQSNY